MRDYGRIDAYAHFAPLALNAYLEKANGGPGPFTAVFKSRPETYDAKLRLELMDRLEVDAHVLVPIPWLEVVPAVAKDPIQAIDASKVGNDGLAHALEADAERLFGVAVLPTINPGAAANELERTVRDLKFVGGVLPVGPTAVPMDEPALEPIFAAAQELDVPLWIHPSRPITWPDHAGEPLSKYFDWQIFGWLADTSSAMLRIAMSGVFERFPKIKIIAHHCGALVPLYATRMETVFLTQQNLGRGIGAAVEPPLLDHFRSFYCDTATFGADAPMLARAADFFGLDRLLFGTDSPMDHAEGFFHAGAVASVEGLDISAAERAAIFAGNARRVLKI
jgi:predicted TIM-barrel fold metal-dependent hydrolase